MNEESLVQRVLHLCQVEKLTQRQRAKMLGIGRKRVKRILEGTGSAAAIPRASILDEYNHLIAHWYKQHSLLKATQVYERLKAYGYQGGYVSVARFTQEYRAPKHSAYHPLTFLPGEEAQVDWFFFNHEHLGQVAGFVYLLSYSRYAWGIFYPKTSFEFFLAGHLECFKHIGGLARCHRYDNLKSVVLKRSPGNIEYYSIYLDGILCLSETGIDFDMVHLYFPVLSSFSIILIICESFSFWPLLSYNISTCGLFISTALSFTTNPMDSLSNSTNVPGGYTPILLKKISRRSG